MRHDGALRIAPLYEMSAVRRFALLRRWIAMQGGLMPSRDALQRIWDEVINSREDATPRLQLGEAEIRRYRQALYRLPIRPSVRDLIVPWQDLSAPLPLPGELGFIAPDENGIEIRAPRHEEKVTIRFQAQGISLLLVGRGGGR